VVWIVHTVYKQPFYNASVLLWHYSPCIWVVHHSSILQEIPVSDVDRSYCLQATLLQCISFVMALFPMYMSSAPQFHSSGDSRKWCGSFILSASNPSTMQFLFSKSGSLRYCIPAIHSENSRRITKFQEQKQHSVNGFELFFFPKQWVRKYIIQQAEPETSTVAITRKLSYVVFFMNSNP